MRNFSSGRAISQGYYKAFIPHHINKAYDVADMEIIRLLSKADLQLRRLDMFSNYVNIDHYIKMHIAKEATQSSQCGTVNTPQQTWWLSGCSLN
jgi:hypothetical protein